ncbi:MAG: 4-hydroxyphenylacetate 3-hydroxylase N-terminal domain-containing protein [Kiloniellales bacterium]|nr:4-hydroxyphenylacetate 3-hydroxylase N-terminal domain-containing protein [Kiloniellales bacterium]
MVVKRQANAADAEAIGAVRCDRPQNGAEYLESLRDGRDVYIYGERVSDVTTHPAFRNTCRMTARLYDALHDERGEKILVPADTDKRLARGLIRTAGKTLFVSSGIGSKLGPIT